MPYFDSESAAEAVAMLVNLAGGRLHKVAVLKLLYFADREAISKSHMMTRSTFYSMPRGPVSSEVLDLINGVTSHPQWQHYLRTDGNIVTLVRPLEIENLSPYEMGLIRQHWDEHCHHVDPLEFPAALVEYSHTLTEWHDPGVNERVPITHEDILRAHNLTAEHMAEILEDFDDVISGLEWLERCA